ncbi:hypothetical protein SMKI_02G1740 [Saccharomyces mikatae IFO 1815]|uniref:Uncharacterized protein n=1 Tax=Saccharomyces mikatae IFO 1815 TaxID=226126 RepID=A0AA35IUQ8_SACMI|nr:uncharacterized protein SMKI_02G1740 [Saccharomyces mikatae IFO 1815]CAI4037304.1 hypothetical protein SMKI_02G1740 [Saccharomyces mikatae IFO 1815]
MEKLGLKSTFPYEYGFDFKTTRLEILNSTKSETALLFSGLSRILARILKYSYNFLASFSLAIKVITESVATVGSREYANSLQIDATERDDEEDVWGSIVLLGVIFSSLIYSCSGKNTFMKRRGNSTEGDECSFKASKPLSIIINIIGNSPNNKGIFVEEKNYEKFMDLHLKESVFDICVPSVVDFSQTEKVFVPDDFGRLSLSSNENTTEALVQATQTLSDIKALTNSTLTNSARGDFLKETERSISKGKEVVKHSVGYNRSLLHYAKKCVHKRNEIMGGFPVQENADSVGKKIHNICESTLIMENRLSNEVFLALFEREPIFFISSLSIEEMRAYEEKQKLFDEMPHGDLGFYDENKIITRTYNLLKVDSQRNWSMKRNISVPSKKMVMNEKGAASTLLWYSTHL